MGPFTNSLQNCGIITQYTMASILEQNGVPRKRNSTLIDMVRNKMSTCNLFESLWILNRFRVNLFLDLLSYGRKKT